VCRIGAPLANFYVGPYVITDKKTPIMSPYPDIPHRAQLNWYLFEQTAPVFSSFWEYIRQHLAKYGIEAAADLWDPAHTALSLSRQNSLLLGQMCSLTFSACQPEMPFYIGSYILDDTEVWPGYYRSVIIVSDKQKMRRLGDDVPQTLCAAISEPDSFSGRFALYQALQNSFTPCNFAKTLYTGTHLDTLLAVASGKADIGAIDCLTWHILQNLLPEQVAQIHIAGYSPQMPGPPLVTMLPDGSDRRAHLEAAIQAAFADTHISAQMKTVGITGYISGDRDRYNDFQACVI